eukprot:CAMPEP_0198275688 /NCGR_PEP_ID=MMETSP1447-20131203/64906_1 /TAXON_ID=420782 /ORGANISM="Chaetoceros dichaeta, Strain CCMP1751" /LENGTH=174 /DNA_ID=CAMNT_0043970577 /DNA_START=45 /DNA_END=569 /DNA_ORIENTATION=+
MTKYFIICCLLAVLSKEGSDASPHIITADGKGKKKSYEVCIPFTGADDDTSDGIVISLRNKRIGKKSSKLKGVAVTALLVNQNDALCCDDCIFDWYNVTSCDDLSLAAGSWKNSTYDTTPKGNGVGTHFLIGEKTKDYKGGVIAVYNADKSIIGCGQVAKRTKDTKCSVYKEKF